MAEAQTKEALFHHGNQDRIDFTPSGAALVSGEVIEIGSGTNVAAVVTSPEGIADGVLGAVAVTGQYRIKKDGTDTFALGAKVSWDDTANQAEPNGGGGESFKLGVAVEAAIAADDHVKVRLNQSQLV